MEGTDLVVDYAALAVKIFSQLSPALAAALGVAGVVLGVKYGYRFFKSFAKG